MGRFIGKRRGGAVRVGAAKRGRFMGSTGRKRAAPAGRKLTATRRRALNRTRTRVTNKNHKALETRWGSETFYMQKRRPKGLPAKLASKLLHLNYNVNINGCEDPLNYPASIQGLCSAGQQNTYILSSAFNIQDLDTMNDLVQSQIQQVNPGGAVTSKPGYLTTRFFVDSVHMESMIQNSDNGVARVIIYDLELKRDAYTIHNTAHAADPVHAWIEGLEDQINSGTGNEFRVVGCRPEDSLLFNQLYRVKKRYYTTLAPGQVHVHRSTVEPRRLINAEVFNQNAITGVRGLTHFTLLIVYGGPVGDLAGTGSTTSAVKLNVITRKDYKFSFIQNDVALEYQNNHLSTSQAANLENLVTGASAAFAQV